MTFTLLQINSTKCSSSNDTSFDVRNPFTNKVVGRAASATWDDCFAAISSADAAFTSWQNSAVSERQNVFQSAIHLLQTPEYEQEMVTAFQEELGVTPVSAEFNWRISIVFLTVILDALKTVKEPETHDSAVVPGAKVTVTRKPLGVILSCAPWNLPGGLTILAACFPIIFGNTVILKPSEYSPRSQAVIVDLLHASGLPNGVLNYIPMARDDAPTLLPDIIADARVRKVVFIGSSHVGRLLAMEAAKHLKPCMMELGGKAPAIVLSDANMETAAEVIVSGGVRQSGQACVSTERVIVMRDAVDRLIPLICSSAKELKITEPLFSQSAVKGFLAMVREATETEGVELLVGDLTADGNVVQAHVLSGVRPGMRMWEVESFGPALSIMVVDSVEEAITMANATKYSLAASVWTSNQILGQEIAAQLRSGYVNINGSTTHCEPAHPIQAAGSGLSGYGEYEINEFTYRQVKVTHS